MVDKKSLILCLGLAVGIPLFLWAASPKETSNNEPVIAPTNTTELLALAQRDKATNHIIKTFVNSRPAHSVASELTPHAEAGDQYAQTLLCYLLWDGLNSLRDTATAIEYCRLSADQGHSAAMVNLGLMFEKQGDIKTAKKWFKKANERGWYSLWRLAAQGKINMSPKQAASYLKSAARANDAQAQYELGRLLNASGSQKEARKWLQKAGENHDFRGFVDLGIIYESGDGVAKDREKAKSYFLKAADANQPVALLRLGYFHSPHINPDAKKSDLSEAIKWFERAAIHPVRKHRWEAKYRLSTIYLEPGIFNSPEKAQKWMLLGAKDNDPRTQFLLGRTLIEDRNVGETQKTEGIKWLLRAKLRGSDEAGQYLQTSYYNSGFQRAYAPYIKWLTREAKNGNATAAFELGQAYLMKNGVDTSTPKAIKYLELAARGKHFEAHGLLAGILLYEHGNNPKIVEKALNHAEIAASNNVTSAQMLLANSYLKGSNVTKNPQIAYAWSLLVLQSRPNEFNETFKNEIEVTLNNDQIQQAKQHVHQCDKSQFQKCPLLVTKI